MLELDVNPAFCFPETFTRTHGRTHIHAQTHTHTHIHTRARAYTQIHTDKTQTRSTAVAVVSQYLWVRKKRKAKGAGRGPDGTVTGECTGHTSALTRRVPRPLHRQCRSLSPLSTTHQSRPNHTPPLPGLPSPLPPHTPSASPSLLSASIPLLCLPQSPFHSGCSSPLFM